MRKLTNSEITSGAPQTAAHSIERNRLGKTGVLNHELINLLIPNALTVVDTVDYATDVDRITFLFLNDDSIN